VEKMSRNTVESIKDVGMSGILPFSAWSNKMDS
jgi:hypothetical protein